MQFGIKYYLCFAYQFHTTYFDKISYFLSNFNLSRNPHCMPKLILPIGGIDEQNIFIFICPNLPGESSSGKLFHLRIFQEQFSMPKTAEHRNNTYTFLTSISNKLFHIDCGIAFVNTWIWGKFLYEYVLLVQLFIVQSPGFVPAFLPVAIEKIMKA